jgi:hypothetical protein
MKKIAFLLACLPFVTQGQSAAPQLLSTSGGGNSTLQWSLGEPVILTLQNNSNALTQGFHQTLLEITAVEEQEDFGSSVLIYPNPVMTSFTIDIQHSGTSPVYMQLFDLNGRMVMAQQMSAPKEIYDVSELASGVYILKLREGEQKEKSWRMVKQN